MKALGWFLAKWMLRIVLTPIALIMILVYRLRGEKP